jgi:hypothetical protein
MASNSCWSVNSVHHDGLHRQAQLQAGTVPPVAEDQFVLNFGAAFGC